jgi:plasmid maintenance system killer protein
MIFLAADDADFADLTLIFRSKQIKKLALNQRHRRIQWLKKSMCRIADSMAPKSLYLSQLSKPNNFLPKSFNSAVS